MTSCVLRIKDENKHNIVNIFINADGYPSGAPYEIAKAFQNHRCVNGIPLHSETPIVNGIGDFATRVVRQYKNHLIFSRFETFKDCKVNGGVLEGLSKTAPVGGMYLVPSDCEYPCDYEYELFIRDNEICIAYSEDGDGQQEFDGTLAEFVSAMEKQEE